MLSVRVGLTNRFVGDADEGTLLLLGRPLFHDNWLNLSEPKSMPFMHEK